MHWKERYLKLVEAEQYKVNEPSDLSLILKKFSIEEKEKKTKRYQELLEDINHSENTSDKPWRPLGQGAYNFVFFNTKKDIKLSDGTFYKGPAVMRIAQDKDEGSVKPERAMRVLNEINPTWPLKKSTQGYLAPYIKGKGTSDALASEFILELYIKTGRIILDGCGNGNIKTPKLKHPVCVDTDFAMRPDSPVFDDYGLLGEPEMKKIKYLLSLEETFEDYWDDYAIDNKPKTVKVIKALLYLERYFDRKDIDDEDLTMELMNHLRDARVDELDVTKALLEEWSGREPDIKSTVVVTQ